MIKDLLNEFSTAQAVTVDAASEEYVNLLKAGSPVEPELYLVVKTIAAAGSANPATTLTITLETDAVSTFDGTGKVTLYTSPAFTLTEMAANTELVKIKVPPGLKQYVRVYFTTGTGDLNAGTFDAFLTPNVEVRL